MTCPCCASLPAGRPAVICTHDMVGFTTREREICQYLLDNKKPSAIAAILTIENRTVYTHMASIAKKLNLRSRRACLIIAALQAAPPER